MTIERETLFKWGVPVLFFTTLLINIAATMGALFPHSQLDIINRHGGFMQPTNATFLIWWVIYIGTGVSVLMEFVKSDEVALIRAYHRFVRPLLLQAFLFHILWTVSWCNDWQLVALVAVAYYARTMIRIMQVISLTASLRQSPWLLKYPMGLHTGWIVVSAIANIDILALSQGMPTDNYVYVAIVAVLLIAIVGASAYFFAKYGNEVVMAPAIWYLIGVVAKHLGASSIYAQVIFWLAVVLTVIAVGIYMHFLQLKQQQNQNK
ncbi:hypothetical protein ACTQ54_11620 [Fundicoccus sp. Sow4_H7]|uniref:hypothetical protein n=1 Tax=Fundicoccus sp. Sow4_H7 TaxID=3438784 RepID=UPI003F8E2D79